MKMLIAWLVVGIPLSWGVYQSLMKTMPLLEARRAAKEAKADK